MTRRVAFAAVAMVGSWTGLVGCAAPPPATTAQARCEQQVYDDPAFKAVFVEVSVHKEDPRYQEQLVLARRKSVNNCLVAQGLAPPGGVQPVTGAHYGLGWFDTN
jgi:hypothetical protein